MTHPPSFFSKIETSALITFAGIILLFSTAIAVTLVAPGFIDSSWLEPTNPYQVQMYEIADPHLYISSSGRDYHTLYHLQKNFTLLSFEENEFLHILAPPELEIYVTHPGEALKLTSRLFLLREVESASLLAAQATQLKEKLRKDWLLAHRDLDSDFSMPDFSILELYPLEGEYAFAIAPTPNGVLENWVDQNFIILDKNPAEPYHHNSGVIYVKNPREYRVTSVKSGSQTLWRYDPEGDNIPSLEHLKIHPLRFVSRQELIQTGEQLFAAEGCWYCHTDQTRTLIQDLVLNGSPSYPAPPSSANEYIYQKITFPGTRRIGPDLSRVGIKRPSRDWHQGHFWSPKTASKGSIMPAMRHFFDDDPRGTPGQTMGIPNYQFEAIFQYLMTKGTRITPPTQAWWLGKDPINIKKMIERKE